VSLPELETYKRTPTFTEHTIPAGLLRDHRTKDGVYGRICVEAGQLRYTDADGEQILNAGAVVVARPQHVHSVAAVGMVRFHVEFCRA